MKTRYSVQGLHPDAIRRGWVVPFPDSQWYDLIICGTHQKANKAMAHLRRKNSKSDERIWLRFRISETVTVS